MKTLVITQYPGNQELDRVTLTDAGDLEYSTGVTRDMFDSLINGQQMSPEQAFDMRTDWSNGYVVSKLAQPTPA